MSAEFLLKFFLKESLLQSNEHVFSTLEIICFIGQYIFVNTVNRHFNGALYNGFQLNRMDMPTQPFLTLPS